MSRELTLVVSTRNENENDNIAPLVNRIVAGLQPGGEIIFVDDSDDATPERIRAVARTAGHAGGSVLLAHRRPGERDGGLGGAVVAGMRASRRPGVCVLDADLQHPPEFIDGLLSTAQRRQADLVVASRRVTQGSARGFGALRSLVSHGSATAAKALFPHRLRAISDPMSGFFLVRRQAVDVDTLRPHGFKILLELMVAIPGLRLAKVGFAFGTRHAGQSKASWREGLTYAGHLAQHRTLRTRVPRFAAVGFSGLIVNQALLMGLVEGARVHYVVAAFVGLLGSTLWNFGLTERWVFPGGAKTSRSARLLLFIGMNTAAFSIQAPLLVALTDELRLPYALSNAIALAVLAAARFLFSEQFIWSNRSLSVVPLPLESGSK